MPIPLAVPLALGGLSKLAGFFSGKKKAKEQKAAAERARVAQVAGLNIGQNQREDQRIARLNLAQSLLGGVSPTTAGGRVNTNVALDPELVKRLGVRRSYDFNSAVPVGADPGAGAGSAFLGGLLGDLGGAAAQARSAPGAVGGFGGSEFRPADIPGMGQPFYDPNKDYEIK